MNNSNINNLNDNYIKNKPEKKYGYILAISDLHYTMTLNEVNEAYLLINDLKTVYFDNPKNKLKLEDIDYLVISGDLVDNADEEGAYDKAFNFINIISKNLKIPFDKIILVPGNHDLSWKICMDAYNLTYGTPGDNDQVVTNVGKDIFYLKRNDEKWQMKFTKFSEGLYEKLYGTAFPLDPKEQIRVLTGDFIDDTKISFFMINTSAMIDPLHRQRTYFDTESLIKELMNLPEGKTLKIVVGHHPLDITNNYGEDILFANVLQNSGFKVYLNGHLHRSVSIDYINPQNINPNMVMIGAGSLSVQVKGLWCGVPEMYNIIRIKNLDNSNKINVTVNTRQREYIGSYWQPAYIYYNVVEGSLSNMYNIII